MILEDTLLQFNDSHVSQPDRACRHKSFKLFPRSYGTCVRLLFAEFDLPLGTPRRELCPVELRGFGTSWQTDYNTQRLTKIRNRRLRFLKDIIHIIHNTSCRAYVGKCSACWGDTCSCLRDPGDGTATTLPKLGPSIAIQVCVHSEIGSSVYFYTFMPTTNSAGTCEQHRSAQRFHLQTELDV